MDDTDADTMQKQRMEHVPSYRRDTAPDENLAIFEKMLKPENDKDKAFCMRAKIDMASLNGTMRDPVMYRCNDQPHHRTGTTFKAYPTYSFACPIVDSIEGVTHALRTTEYDDQNEQYKWLQAAMNLRVVHIHTFGKMNFINTVLSKRKLNWFVEEGKVEGWFDPRFPTIQGVVRRGIDIDALKRFIVSQGASRNNITMEWDKFWADNKKVLEEKCHRYMGVCTPATVTISNYATPGVVELAQTTLHPQKPEMGTRVIRRSDRLIIEKADMDLFKKGDTVTFLRWGNFLIEEYNKDENSVVAKFLPDATDFSKTTKLTWLADVTDNIQATLFEFDHLITKRKIEDEENFKDFENKNTMASQGCTVDACIRLCTTGQVIQLERRGFYRIDKAYGGPDAPAHLFFIPDGRQKEKMGNQSAFAKSK